MWQTGPLNCTETKPLKAAASTHICFAIFLSQKVVNESFKMPTKPSLQILWNICPKNQNTQTVEILLKLHKETTGKKWHRCNRQQIRGLVKQWVSVGQLSISASAPALWLLSCYSSPEQQRK